MPDKQNIPRANSRVFLMSKFSDLWKQKNATIKIMSSRQYEDERLWWFKTSIDDIKQYEFILFAGARDYENKDFQLIKVPTAFLYKNLANIDNSAQGKMINLYIKFDSFIDVRYHNNLSFKEFCIN